MVFMAFNDKVIFAMSNMTIEEKNMPMCLRPSTNMLNKVIKPRETNIHIGIVTIGDLYWQYMQQVTLLT